MKRGFLFLLLIVNTLFLSATERKDSNSVRSHESELAKICQKLYHTRGLTDADKEKLNGEMLQTLETALNEPGSFENYQFDSLRKDIGVLLSPDEHFRIIHWNIPKSDGTHDYYGFIQSYYKAPGKKSQRVVQLYPLLDKSSEIRNAENFVGDNKKWFGALYYKIILKKTKSKTYYTLLGWDGNDKFTQKKIIDVLTFDNQGIPHFGADIFNFPKKYPKRVIFEYSATCTVSLKYNSKKDSIIFDHLAPTQPQLEGQFQYYCGDMSYDGLGFRKGKWNYGADVKAINEKDEKDKLYHDPHDRSEGHDQSNVIIERKKGKGKKKK